jgi:hypothetical protein
LQARVDRLPNRVMAGGVALMGALMALPVPLRTAWLLALGFAAWASLDGAVARVIGA